MYSIGRLISKYKYINKKIKGETSTHTSYPTAKSSSDPIGKSSEREVVIYMQPVNEEGYSQIRETDKNDV